MRPERALLAFAVAVFVFHTLPQFLGPEGDRLSVLAPFAVVATAAAVLFTLAPGWTALLVALLASILYAHGHGIHLAADAVVDEAVGGEIERVARAWREDIGRVEWLAGLIGLIVALCAAEGRGTRVGRTVSAATVVLLAFSLFASTVEGGTWSLALAAAVPMTAWALLRPRPVVTICASSFALAALLMATWALWQRGMPPFTEVR